MPVVAGASETQGHVAPSLHVAFASEPQVHLGSSEAMRRIDSDTSSNANEEATSGEEVGPTDTQLSKAKKVRASFKAPEEWMVIFGCILAVCAGIVNTTALLDIGTCVGNMTGMLARLGMHVEGVRIAVFAPRNAHHESILTKHVDQSIGEVATSFLILSSFIFGAFLCGLVIPKNMLNFGGKSFYGVALIGESALLFACALVMHTSTRMVLAACLAACASGLQNAMCTMHLGAVVRTTHVTGTATDIGSSLGRATMNVLKRTFSPKDHKYVDQVELEVDLQKFRILAAIFVSYLAGCFCGAYLDTHLGSKAFLVPASITGLLGVLYTCFREQLKAQWRRIEERLFMQEVAKVESMIGQVETFLEDLRHEQQMAMSEGRISPARRAEFGGALEVMRAMTDLAQQYRSEATVYHANAGSESSDDPHERMDARRGTRHAA